MSRAPKILESARTNPAGVAFSDLQYLVEKAGFVLKRTRGDHHVYSKAGVKEIVDLQPSKGNKKDAKAYQVRQVLELIEAYGIEVE
jgi:hypothetical protein